MLPLSTELYFALFVVFVALCFDFSNGMHDAANSIATIVATRVLSPLQAVAWAAFFNFIAAFVFGTGVAKTVAQGLVDVSVVDQYVVLSGLIGAIIWNLITWRMGLPSSSSHSLLAGYAGAAVAKGGINVLLLQGWLPLMLFIVLSPLIGFILGAFNMIAVSWIFRRVRPSKVDGYFRWLQLVSAGLYSLGHGTNDAQKTMGIIAALLIAAGKPEWTEGGYNMFGREHHLAMWIVFSCYTAIALGTMAGGWRIVKTMGMRIARLQPVGGFCAETAGATTLIATAMAGIPISTTHAITGAILGVGTTHGVRSVRWIWGERMVVAWILTLPCSFFIAAVMYFLIHHLIEPLF